MQDNIFKPCPFCGETRIGIYIVDNGGPYSHKDHIDKWAVQCETCWAEGPWKKSREGAINAWNYKHTTST